MRLESTCLHYHTASCNLAHVCHALCVTTPSHAILPICVTHLRYHTKSRIPALMCHAPCVTTPSHTFLPMCHAHHPASPDCVAYFLPDVSRTLHHTTASPILCQAPCVTTGCNPTVTHLVSPHYVIPLSRTSVTTLHFYAIPLVFAVVIGLVLVMHPALPQSVTHPSSSNCLMHPA